MCDKDEDVRGIYNSYLIGIRNSFDPQTEVQFSQKYYQILIFDRFKEKVKKLMLVEQHDYGKSNWFVPFQGN